MVTNPPWSVGLIGGDLAANEGDALPTGVFSQVARAKLVQLVYAVAAGPNGRGRALLVEPACVP